MDTENLRVFCAVATAKNLSRAARVLNYSQPAVSARMARLERSLGVELIHRHNRGVSLTAAGEVVAAHARRILELEDSIQERLSHLSDHGSRLLPVAAGHIAGNYLLACSVWTFEQGNRGVNVRLTLTTPSEAMHSVASGRAEIGVFESGVKLEDGLVAEVVASEPVILVTAPSFAQRHHLGAQAEPSALAGCSLLTMDYGSGLRELTDEFLSGDGRALATMPSLKMTSLEGLKVALAGGVGMAFLPRCAVIREILEGKLMEVRLPGGCFDLDFCAAYQQGERLSRQCAEFLEFLKRPCAVCL